MLVEADTITSDAWSSAIAASGHSVLTASGTREALSVIRDGGIDVVVIDAYDPSVGVVELADRMRALPDAPPIILISESPAAPAISVRIAAAHFVPKPCEPHEVVTVVERLVSWLRALPFVDDEPTVRLRPLAFSR